METKLCSGLLGWRLPKFSGPFKGSPHNSDCNISIYIYTYIQRFGVFRCNMKAPAFLDAAVLSLQALGGSAEICRFSTHTVRFHGSGCRLERFSAEPQTLKLKPYLDLGCPTLFEHAQGIYL